MDEKTAKFLAPIRAICKEIVSNDSIDDCMKELIKKITTKDTVFYQFHTFLLLMELLKDNPNLEANKVREIFKVLDLILNNGSNKKSKRKFAVDFYNYFISLNETTPDIYIEESLALFKLTPETEEELLDIHLCFIQKCLSVSKIVNAKANLEFINQNVRQLIKMDSSEIQVKLLQLLSKIVYNYYSKTKSWTMSVDFLQNSIYQELKTSNMKIKTDEAFLEYTNFIGTIMYSRNADMLEICCKIIAECHKLLDEKEHKVLNKVLHKSLSNLPYSDITEKALSNVYQSYFKDATSSTENVLQHKVIEIIRKHFITVAIHLEKSASCIKICHDFVFSLFNLLKYIKNQDDKNSAEKKCCADTRRHSIFDLSIEMIKFITRALDDKIFTKDIEKYLNYYLDYSLNIYKDSKCPSKKTMFKVLQNVLYDILASFYNDHQDILHSDLKKFLRVYNIMISLKEISEDEKIVKHIINLGMCMNNVNYEETERNAQSFAEIITQPIIYSLKTKDVDQKLPKLVCNLRSAVLKFNFKSAVDYLKTKLKSSDFDAYISELTLLELRAVYRYDTPNPESYAELFNAIFDNTDDLEYLGRACLSINDRAMRIIGLKKFKDLNERLEKYKTDNIQISLALAMNNHYLYCIEQEDIEAKIVEESKDTKTDHPSCLTLENEVKLLKHLDKFLEYSMDTMFKVKENPKELAKIPSMKLFIAILHNVSTQYFVRGIANKDLETKLVLWNLLQYDQRNYYDTLIDTAAFFLDNMDRMIGSSGHYITFSKRMNYVRAEELIAKANPVLDILLQDIQDKHERHQVRPLNYMLSLWVYYAVNGRKAESLKIWQKFEETRKICNLQAPVYIGTIEAKKHMGIVDISLRCFKKNAADHIYKAMKNLQTISTVFADYTNNFQFLYRNIIVKAMNYAMNRMIDVDHYASTMMWLKDQAVKKGLFIKTLDFLSLSVMRHLNMEKLDEAKTDLKSMSKILKLDDDILTEIPIETKPASQIIEIQNNEITVRKAIPKPTDSKSKIEIFNDSFDNTRSLTEQLRNFVHDYSCNCLVCEYPHLKFMLFQMGCHYSRLLFLMNKFDISKNFNNYALGPWRHCSVKILRTKENGVFNINKKEFITFSIRWLFQVVDSFVMTKDYSKIEEILTEVELLCTNNIEDYECIKQALHARMQNLEFLLQHGKTYFKESDGKSLTYEDFIKTKSPKSSTSVMLTVKNPKHAADSKKKSPQSEPSKKAQKSASSKTKLIDSVIYIDSEDSDKETRARPPKKVVSSVPPKSTRATENSRN
ncbi:uncharacterized protein [Chironomus tepperi]|uniref:uncharacterized protein n=1 Tax=Chironomus tepperi TaxID=113505 RepID=UPI00391FAB48